MRDASNISHMISSIWLVWLYQVLCAFIFFAAGCKGRRERIKKDWSSIGSCNLWSNVVILLSLYFLLCNSTQRCKRQRGHLHSIENKAHVKFATFAMEFPPWFGSGLANRARWKALVGCSFAALPVSGSELDRSFIFVFLYRFLSLSLFISLLVYVWILV
jgi:hypothetical protein